MKNILSGFFLSIISLLLLACNTMKHVPCSELNEELFKVKHKGEDEKVFFYTENDTLKTYTFKEGVKSIAGNDSLKRENYPRIVLEVSPPDRLDFYRCGMNLAFLVLPVKFRPQAGEVPAQLNSDFNGALYLGYSFDRYSLAYAPVTSDLFSRRLNNYRLSFGGFIGIGSTLVLHTSTADAMYDEYDGVVLQKGVAANISVNNFTMGMALGFDNLLGKHRKVWIYQNKPYLAFIIGFNIQ